MAGNLDYPEKLFEDFFQHGREYFFATRDGRRYDVHVDEIKDGMLHAFLIPGPFDGIDGIDGTEDSVPLPLESIQLDTLAYWDRNKNDLTYFEEWLRMR